jgi:Ras-related protein Rab-11A
MDIIKVIIIGESGVGKTNIMTRYTTGEFLHDSPSTIGVEFFTKKLQINNRDITIQIWDTAGQERFKAITRSIYHGAKAIIVVYDITNIESYNKVESWIREVKNHVHDNAPICLVGNKNDLVHLREVQEDTVIKFAKENKLLFFETSAASDNNNISLVFENLVREVIDKNINITCQRQQKSKINIVLDNKKKNIKTEETKKDKKCSCN